MCLKTKSVDRKKSVTTASGIQLYQIYQLRFIGSSMRLSYYFQKKDQRSLKNNIIDIKHFWPSYRCLCRNHLLPCSWIELSFEPFEVCFLIQRVTQVSINPFEFFPPCLCTHIPSEK